MNDSDMIVDQIYEASIIPDLWMSVLDSIAGVVDSLGSIMVIRGADGWGDWKSSDELVNFMVKFTNSNIPLRTETTTRLIGAKHPGFLSEALAIIGLPAGILSPKGRVLAANRLLEEMNAHVHWRSQDRMALMDASANALFEQAIE